MTDILLQKNTIKLAGNENMVSYVGIFLVDATPLTLLFKSAIKPAIQKKS